jgi:hypothetical protein
MCVRDAGREACASQRCPQLEDAAAPHSCTTRAGACSGRTSEKAFTGRAVDFTRSYRQRRLGDVSCLGAAHTTLTTWRARGGAVAAFEGSFVLVQGAKSTQHHCRVRVEAAASSGVGDAYCGRVLQQMKTLAAPLEAFVRLQAPMQGLWPHVTRLRSARARCKARLNTCGALQAKLHALATSSCPEYCGKPLMTAARAHERRRSKLAAHTTR